MRSKFPGYFRPNKNEFDNIWKQGLVVPDTNILLHLLRFRRETRDEIIKTLKAFQPRLATQVQRAEMERLVQGLPSSTSAISEQVRLAREHALGVHSQADLARLALGYPTGSLAAEQARLEHEKMTRGLATGGLGDYADYLRKTDFERAALAHSKSPLESLYEQAREAELEQLRLRQASKKLKDD